jgi:phospholipid/cholesterol/gamma-HCH transport system substrate-binding protein
VIDSLAECVLPELRHLEIFSGTDGYGWDGNVETFRPYLEAGRFPRLTRLGLRNGECADDLAKAIAAAPVLSQLEVISTILAQKKDDLAYSITTASKFMGALAESIGSGPYFKTLLVNLIPYQALQPWVDAAFKKRGIDPEEFWRNAGLPAFRFPDPNGTAHGNGAPPAAPDVFEGTPEFPGPAVRPGAPCSYTPPPDGIPSPGDPLPCLDLTQGPYGPMLGGTFGPPDVALSAPNPDAMAPNHGVPAAAVPGQLGPTVPGAPGPALAPGPPGARTVPVGPLPGPETIAPLDTGGS